jgi:hypothetical protein
MRSVQETASTLYSPYGVGTVVAIRKHGSLSIFEVKLAFGTLYTSQVTSRSLRKIMTTEELTASFEALEKMRKLNLEVECNEFGVICDHEKCALCLLSSAQSTENSNCTTDVDEKSSMTSSYTSSMLSLLGGGGWTSKEQGAAASKQQPPKKGAPCFICGNPACPQHASDSFRKQQKLTLCLSCEELFNLELVSDDCDEEDGPSLEAPSHLHKVGTKVDQMVNTYDRCLLLLCYAAQFIPDIAAQLETSETRNNQLRLGTSSVGLVSGTLGFVGAATILTPFGPPLIMASVALSGGSLVAAGGNAAVNYFDKANKFADKIIAYNEMLSSILQAAHRLCKRILSKQDHDPDDLSFKAKKCTKIDETNTAESFFKSISLADTEKKSTSADISNLVVASKMTTTTRLMTGASVPASLTTAAAGSATATTTASSSELFSTVADMTPIIGTAVSVATMALDAHIATGTWKKIRAGNPCEKAVTLRTIQKNLDSLPSTNDLDIVCRHLLSTMAQDNHAISID